MWVVCRSVSDGRWVARVARAGDAGWRSHYRHLDDALEEAHRRNWVEEVVV